MTRNSKGLIGWSTLAFIFGIILLIPMIIREVYLYYKYLRPCSLKFEWEDVINYGLTIGIFSLLHWIIIEITGLPLYLAL